MCVMKKLINRLAAVRRYIEPSIRIKLCVLLGVGMLSGCAKALPAQIKNMLFSQKRNTGIVDLTRVSATMVYAEVFNMMVEPENYVGKTIKMNGLFYVYPDEKKGTYTFACIIMDATACCAQGIEFRLRGEHAYPADYPEPNTNITVQGTFYTFEEDGFTHTLLIDADMTVRK